VALNAFPSNAAPANAALVFKKSRLLVFGLVVFAALEYFPFMPTPLLSSIVFIKFIKQLPS
jgi:hypothetical protein